MKLSLILEKSNLMEADLVHMRLVLPVFKIFKKLYICILKNRHIYFTNTYICPEYSWKVLVEIALYFKLQEKNKFVATYSGRYLSENFLFCIAQNTTFFKFLPYLRDVYIYVHI
jgi:hypothetical protein